MKNHIMKTITTTVISLLCVLQLSGQSIEGKIADQNNESIFYATIALYNSADSTLVKAESTDVDGAYKISDIKDGNYYLDINMLGYESKRIDNIEISGDKTVKHDISLSEDSQLLSTIEIKEKLPLLEQKADKLIVNVADNITNTSGSLLDVMKKVPGMIVVQDRLSMAGSGTPTILLNGKSTQYMDVQALLRDMPGDNIKKVEIIHQPGAEYEAAGSGPIINIILKKNSLFGTNGSVTVGVGKGELWDYTTGINLSHYQGAFNITGSIGYSKNAWIDGLSIVRRLSNIDDAINGTYDQVNRDAATPITYRGNVRMDWDVTEKHRIGLETKYYNNKNARIAKNVTNVDLTDTDQQDYTLTTENDINRAWNYRSINPYYIFEIDTAGQKLEFDFSLAQFDREGVNTLSTVSTQSAMIDQQRYTQPGINDIMATSLDYTLPLSDIIELKTGVKYSYADLDNNLISEFRIGNGEWANNMGQSNEYLFTEKIYAGYGKLSWKKNEWSGTAGLRYEKSESIGNSVTLDSVQVRDINQLFPSVSISRKLGVLTPSVAYSYRIDRPRYSTLNPFVYYIDPFTSERGNPNILPELTHSAKFTLAFEGQPFFNIEYKNSNNSIVEVTEQEATSQEAFKTDVNFDNREVWSGSLYFPMDMIPGISGGYGGVILTQTSFNSNYIEGVFDRSAFNTTAFIQLEMSLPWEINAELGGWYTSGQQEGIFRSEYLYGSSFGISKKILDGNGKVSFGVEDFAYRFWNARVDYQQDMDIQSTWQAPVMNFRFSYKFGNQHLKSKSKNRSSASDVLNRAQG